MFGFQKSSGSQLDRIRAADLERARKDGARAEARRLVDGIKENDWADVSVDSCARPARDAQIIFRGAEFTLWVPATRGREIYDTVLAGLARD